MIIWLYSSNSIKLSQTICYVSRITVKQEVVRSRSAVQLRECTAVGVGVLGRWGRCEFRSILLNCVARGFSLFGK